MSTTLQIERVCYGGKGLGRLNGKAIFVPGTVAGDKVSATITSDEGRYADARLSSIIEPSKLRTASLCPYDLKCGGCCWQQVPLGHQTDWKREFIRSSLQRIGKLPSDTSIEMWSPGVRSGYRNRCHLKASGLGGYLSLGFYEEGSHEIVDITACANLTPALNHAISTLRQLLASHLPEEEFSVHLQEVAEGGVNVIFYVDPQSTDIAFDRTVMALKDLPIIHWAGLSRDIPADQFDIYDEQFDLKYLSAPGAFLQAHTELNRKLRRYIFERYKNSKTMDVVDLFGGSGNLSAALAKVGHRVLVVESSAKAVAAGRRMKEVNQLESLQFKQRKAEQFVGKARYRKPKWDLLICDPPREGMKACTGAIRDIAPKQILYISCNPTTLARDLGYICRKNRYRLETLIGIDFFPNTFHVESLALLSLENS